MTGIRPLTRSFPRWFSTESQREALAAYLFILPSYIGFTVFVLGPILVMIALSFTHYDILTPPTFVGLKNFASLFADPRLGKVYLNTVIFTVGAVSGNVGLGVMLAVLLNRKLPAVLKYVFRSIYFFPSIIGIVYITIIWQFLYQRDTGVINYYLGLIGVDPVRWISSAQWALPSIVVMDVWKNVGFAMLVALAGLQSIPREYYEAASVDGANGWTSFRHITLPLLSPTIFFLVTMYMIGAFKVFDSIFVLTQGGPGDSSRSIVLYIYEKAFKSYDMGYASAISLSLLTIISIFTIVQFGLARRWVHYE
jgi:multiple sugar transport system permease protein